MIDEELYKIATDELNSDERKPAVWARACALASDDHDEARFLYTNLRVEEMLSKDGKQRTFSTNRSKDQQNLSSASKLDTLELALDDDDETERPVSSRLGVSNDATTPLPIDDLLSYDTDDTDAPTSVAGNAQALATDPFDADSFDELDALTKHNQKTDTVLSNLTGEAITTPGADNALNQNELVVSNVIDATASTVTTQTLSPESQRSALLSEDLERQARDMGQDSSNTLGEVGPETAPELNVAHQDSVAPTALHDTVRPDYADNNILDLDDGLTQEIYSELDSGVGRSFMVFSRNGTVKAIKRGASWPALLFTFPWLLSKAMFGTALVYAGLWLVSIAGLLTSISLWLNASPVAPVSIKLWTLGFGLLALIGLFYIPFRYGNSWVANKLQKRGFEFESAVSASNKQEAINRLLNATD